MRRFEIIAVIYLKMESVEIVFFLTSTRAPLRLR